MRDFTYYSNFSSWYQLAMRLFRKLKDYIRTVMGVRTQRQLLPVQGKPSLGGSIVKDRFRIRLKHPIDDDMWRWLCDMGWRAMPVNNNRRKYTIVSEKAFERLVKADPTQRGALLASMTEGRRARRA